MSVFKRINQRSFSNRSFFPRWSCDTFLDHFTHDQTFEKSPTYLQKFPAEVMYSQTLTRQSQILGYILLFSRLVQKSYLFPWYISKPREIFQLIERRDYQLRLKLINQHWFTNRSSPLPFLISTPLQTHSNFFKSPLLSTEISSGTLAKHRHLEILAYILRFQHFQTFLSSVQRSGFNQTSINAIRRSVFN